MVIDLGLARSNNLWNDNLDTGKCRYRKESGGRNNTTNE
jgi:hypothetical protein